MTSTRSKKADSASSDKAQSLGLDRVYIRDPVPEEAKGILTGVAELLTGDDGAGWPGLICSTSCSR